MTAFIRFTVDGETYFGVLNNQVAKVVEGDIFSSWRVSGKEYPIQEVKLLAPVVPGKIIGVGLNYYTTVAARQVAVPREPVLFLKPSTTIIGPEENIIYPPDIKQLAYEAELAVVIKDTIKKVNREEALDHVLGYTCANDLTAKDKMTGGPWTAAKSYDTFLPLGPYIVTDLKPDNLYVEMYLNGNQTQNSSTSDMIFDVPSLISYISQIMTLNPGDVLITGTPPGAGFIQSGDCLEVKIGGIGLLRNGVELCGE